MLRGQIESVSDDADEEFLPLEAKFGVRSTAGEAQHFGLILNGEDGNSAGAFDLVLPPADEALVMLRAEILQPERMYGDSLEARREAKRCAQGIQDEFEGDFELAKAEGRVAAGVEADVGELFITRRG